MSNQVEVAIFSTTSASLTEVLRSFVLYNTFPPGRVASSQLPSTYSINPLNYSLQLPHSPDGPSIITLKVDLLPRSHEANLWPLTQQRQVLMNQRKTKKKLNITKTQEQEAILALSRGFVNPNPCTKCLHKQGPFIVSVSTDELGLVCSNCW